jgi:hypothetical protein
MSIRQFYTAVCGGVIVTDNNIVVHLRLGSSNGVSFWRTYKNVNCKVRPRTGHEGSEGE